jgi:hypothetical protein
VVQDSFKFGDDKEIVRFFLLCVGIDSCVESFGQIVALQNDVLALNKKQLKRPTRESLAPGPLMGGHSDIVNSPW